MTAKRKLLLVDAGVLLLMLGVLAGLAALVTPRIGLAQSMGVAPSGASTQVPAIWQNVALVLASAMVVIATGWVRMWRTSVSRGDVGEIVDAKLGGLREWKEESKRHIEETFKRLGGIDTAIAVQGQVLQEIREDIREAFAGRRKLQEELEGNAVRLTNIERFMGEATEAMKSWPDGT